MKATIWTRFALAGAVMGSLTLPLRGAEPAAGTGAANEDDFPRSGRSRFAAPAIAQRFDRNGDGRVDRREVDLAPELWERLDRNHDEQLTADDLDWSNGGKLDWQRTAIFSLGKEADTKSDGRISSDEWQALFRRAAGEKGFLTEEDLERLVFRPGLVKAARERKNRGSIDGLLREYRHSDSPPPEVDSQAPDFELGTIDGSKRIRLSSSRGQRPVVLIFGSFTCGNYRTHTGSLEELYQRWKSQVDFISVYVREAHPVGDRPATETNAKVGVLEKQPKTLAERQAIAQRCVAACRLTMPMVVDEIDNQVAQRYAALPDRLYLVDRQGRIAFQGGPGPFAFNPDELEQSLILLLNTESSASAARP